MHRDDLATLGPFALAIIVETDDHPADHPADDHVNAGDILQSLDLYGRVTTADGADRRVEWGAHDNDGRRQIPRPSWVDGGWIAHTVRPSRCVSDDVKIRVWRKLDTFAEEGTPDTGPDPQPRSRAYWIQCWRDWIDSWAGGNVAPYGARLVLFKADREIDTIDSVGCGWCESEAEALACARDHLAPTFPVVELREILTARLNRIEETHTNRVAEIRAVLGGEA